MGLINNQRRCSYINFWNGLRARELGKDRGSRETDTRQYCKRMHVTRVKTPQIRDSRGKSYPTFAMQASCNFVTSWTISSATRSHCHILTKICSLSSQNRLFITKKNKIKSHYSFDCCDVNRKLKVINKWSLLTIFMA